MHWIQIKDIFLVLRKNLDVDLLYALNISGDILDKKYFIISCKISKKMPHHWDAVINFF